MQGMILRATTSTATGVVLPPDEIVSNDPPYVITYVNTSPQSVATNTPDVLIQVPTVVDAESTVATGIVTVTDAYVVDVVDPLEVSAATTVDTVPQSVTTGFADVQTQVPVMADAESTVTTGPVTVTDTNLVTIT